MGSLRHHSKDEFWRTSDRRQDGRQNTNVKVWDATVVEVGTGADAGKVKVRLPGEVTDVADLPLAPVLGPTPAVGEQVTAMADGASRRVVTGDDNLLFIDPVLTNPGTGTTMAPSHYYNINTAGASPTLPSGNVDPTSVILIRTTAAGTVNAASGETVNGTLTSFAMPAFSAVILAARGTLGWAVIASSGVPAFAPAGGAGALTGEVKMWALPTAPDGYLFCVGGTQLIASYPALAAALGTTYGGDGVTTFGIPDFRGRVPVGVGTGDAADATAHTLGEKEGAESHTLTTAQMPSHDHGGSVGGGAHTHDSTDNPGNHQHLAGADFVNNSPTTGNASRWTTMSPPGVADSTANTSSAGGHTHAVNSAGSSHTHTIPANGGGGAHNNLQPSLGINFIIKT